MGSAGTVTLGAYEEALSVTSQFYYCGLPLRLDTYSKCLFQCKYCFAHARGGSRPDDRYGAVQVQALAQRLKRVAGGKVRSVMDDFISRRQPIHFGGMSDPFSPQERLHRVTLDLLKMFRSEEYPLVLSTKSCDFLQDEYLAHIAAKNVVLQVSLCDLDERLLAKVDRGTPTPKQRLAALRTAVECGAKTMVRIQPLLPSREGQLADLIGECAVHGATHIALEHLKVPVEASYEGTRILSDALGFDVLQHYKARGAKRVGREWVLPVDQRLHCTLEARTLANSLGMTFGAADNDLLWLSDGGCCCSGVAHYPGFESYHRFTFTEAIRKALVLDQRIFRRHLEDTPVAVGTMSHHVNSKSRISVNDGPGAQISDYIDCNWMGSPAGPCPTMFHGVFDTGEVDEKGFKIYDMEPKLRSLAQTGVAKR